MQGQEIDQVAGREVYGADGEKIGTARQVYTDDQTGEPAWATVRTGLLGLKESFVPLTNAEMSGERLTVPYTKDFVKDAPNIDEDGHLTPDQEQELYAYYGRTDQDNREDDAARQMRRGNDGSRDADTEAYASGPTEGAMTVSEERVSVGKQRRESGRARLRKYVVTEDVTQTVPVKREEVRVEREPITGSNRDAAFAGPGIFEDEHEIVLHEQQPVVEKETVPVERVRLDTETVTDQQTVTEEVRKERVDTEADITRGYN